MDNQLIQLTRPAASAEAATVQPSNGARLFMCSSLYLAVYGGQMEVVMALLLQRQHCAAEDQATGVHHGQCDIHEVSAERNTVLHVAADQGHDELVQELYCRFRDKIVLSSRNSALDTPLHCAARAGRDRAVSLLVHLAQDCGESILACKNEAGDTALHLAAKHGHGVAVEALVSAAPELASELNDAGVSPLYLAVVSGSVPSVRAITTRCKDASSVGPSSQNALHAAVFQSSEMVWLLLQWKPSLAGKVDGNGSSPLHFASSDGDRFMVRAILRAAPPSTVYKQDYSDGLSALHVAALMGHAGVVEELMRACPEAAELRDGHGRTFLHAAAKEGYSSVVSLAMEKPILDGVMNAPDRDSNTPLHLAVVAGVAGVAEALLSSGKVQADVMNKDGHAPFDLAAKLTSFSSMVSMVVMLTAFGAQSHSRSLRQDHLKQWSGRDITQLVGKTSDSLAVVAVLIATVAFSAAFNVAGGYGDDGKAILQEKPCYAFFIIFDSIALTTSVVGVILLVYGKASGSWKSFVFSLHCIWVSLISMMVAFCASLVAVTRRMAIFRSITFLLIFTGIFALGLVMVHWIFKTASFNTIVKFLWRSSLPGRQHVIERRRVTRQYPFAGAYSRNLFMFVAINTIAYFGVLIAIIYIAYRPIPSS